MWLLLVAMGCDQPASPDTASAGVPMLAASKSKSSSMRSGDLKLRLLHGGATGADLEQDGLVVDLGRHDKYVQGEARITWGRFVRGPDGSSHAELLNGARLTVPDRGGARLVALRGQSGTGCTVELMVDRRSAGTRRLGSKWATLRWGLPEVTAAGQRTLELRLTYDGRPSSPALARWIWLGAGKVPTTVSRVGKRSFAQPMQSLLADTPRSYAFQIQVPDRCNLVFDYGARALTLFQVKLRLGQEAPVTMFAARAGGSIWYQGWIDLKEYAGRKVGLELHATAGRGRPASLGAAWGEPMLSCADTER